MVLATGVGMTRNKSQTKEDDGGIDGIGKKHGIGIGIGSWSVNQAAAELKYVMGVSQIRPAHLGS